MVKEREEYGRERKVIHGIATEGRCSEGKGREGKGRK